MNPITEIALSGTRPASLLQGEASASPPASDIQHLASRLQTIALSRTRRAFLKGSGVSLGAIALASLLDRDASASPPASNLPPPASRLQPGPLASKQPPLPAKAKAVIYLHMSGAPPQHDLLDYKPKLKELNGQPCPQELLKNQRFAFIKGTPKMLGSPFKFQQYGKQGTWMSELLPNLGRQADQLAIVRSMWTDQFNHAPAELYLFTGNARVGYPGMGAWVTYGLGTVNQDLPGFIVLISGGTDPTGGKALWSTGSLPSVYQGVQCRTTGEPVLYVSNPKGMDRDVRRQSLDTLKTLNELELQQSGDPETRTRIQQYELAFRMQTSVPEAMDISKEPQKLRDEYGAQPGAASFANNCLLARRLVERGVRFVQLFDWGWDCHGTGTGDDLVNHLPQKTKEIDQSIAALLRDLEVRGLLDETLVVWGGEFGRTSMNEARGGSTFLGRDHHPECFSIWMAGAGIRAGVDFGATDELGYFVTEGKSSVHDLQATILHLLGLDPWKFSFAFQGLQQRLIGPEGAARIMQEILA